GTGRSAGRSRTGPWSSAITTRPATTADIDRTDEPVDPGRWRAGWPLVPSWSCHIRAGGRPTPRSGTVGRAMQPRTHYVRGPEGARRLPGLWPRPARHRLHPGSPEQHRAHVGGARAVALPRAAAADGP